MTINLTKLSSLSLSSQRLTFELMTAKHWQEFKLLQCDPELIQFIGEVLPAEAVREKFEQRTNYSQPTENHWHTFMLYSKGQHEFIGSVGFRLVDIDMERAEIGYIVLPAFQGKGYVSEAGSALVDWLFSELNARKVIATCTTENTGSYKTMHKFGMTREGTLVQDYRINDKWHDSYLYGLINPRYRND